jgi:aspartyl-tRNA(Asn)/glutamyl-tRNA(Gln) amidotransferase subunit C
LSFSQREGTLSLAAVMSSQIRRTVMPMDPAEVRHIASLVRIALSDAEVEAYGQQLSQVLAQFEVLAQLDTSGVDAAPPGWEDAGSVGRDDAPGPCLSTEEVLGNAPRREGDFFRVKAVLEE